MSFPLKPAFYINKEPRGRSLIWHGVLFLHFRNLCFHFWFFRKTLNAAKEQFQIENHFKTFETKSLH